MLNKKILMVCLGNICRSPLAEGVLRFHLKKAGLDQVLVDSAGTSGWHDGEKPDKRSAQNAREHGIDISKLVSRKFLVADFDRFDLIYVMDQSNYRDVISQARHENDKMKVDLLLNAKWPNQNRAVPDPYYGGESGFENVFQLVEEACLEIVSRLKSEKA
jgi:protein-tyrosine phosphatase